MLISQNIPNLLSILPASSTTLTGRNPRPRCRSVAPYTLAGIATGTPYIPAGTGTYTGPMGGGTPTG